MTEHEQMRKDWNAAVTEFLMLPPSDPRCAEVYLRVRELDKQCRAAGVLPAVR